MRWFRSLASSARRAFGRSARDERGSITVEFVIWVPILVLWFAGSISYFDGYRERGRAAKMSHVVSDILTRQAEIDDDLITDLYDMMEIMLPGTPPGMVLRVTSVEYRDGSYQVLWSVASGGGAPMETEDIPVAKMPAMAELDTVIVTETTVPFQPALDIVGIGERTWTSFLPARPRFVHSVAYVD